ncbi:MAG: DUF4886 domain-containing protein [Clostridia bacterium]|nr:DUF4886 domain-containing protein [Clostridia bacterium]
MKILSIGNSFSEDAHAYLHALAKQRNIDLTTVDLAIGGCSLERHWDNVTKNSASYLYSKNGEPFWGEPNTAIEPNLKSDSYDVITLQQVSGYSGEYESYQPYLNNLIEYVRAYQPSAKIYIHRTWAYEIDSSHGDFPKYGSNQRKMYEAICKATTLASEETGADIIPSGDVIQALRERVGELDYANGGESLCRDGFHLSETYGRYAAALTWLATLTGKRVEPMPFMELSIDIIAKICEIVNEITHAK